MLDLPRRLTEAPYDERVTASEAGFGSVLLGPVEQQAGRLRTRVQSLLTILLVSTNLVGAVIVFVLSTFVLPGPKPNHAMTLALAIGVPVYVGVAVLDRRQRRHHHLAAGPALGDPGEDPVPRRSA